MNVSEVKAGQKVLWRKPGKSWESGVVIDHPGVSTGVWVRGEDGRVWFVYGSGLKLEES